MEKLTSYYSVEDKIKLLSLESEKDDVLKNNEETMRLKSRAIWIDAGDNNTQFFHSYASYRRNNNTIWEIKNEYDSRVNSQVYIKKATEDHFKSLFKDPRKALIGN